MGIFSIDIRNYTSVILLFIPKVKWQTITSLGYKMLYHATISKTWTLYHVGETIQNCFFCVCRYTQRFLKSNCKSIGSKLCTNSRELWAASLRAPSTHRNGKQLCTDELHSDICMFSAHVLAATSKKFPARFDTSCRVVQIKPFLRWLLVPAPFTGWREL